MALHVRVKPHLRDQVAMMVDDPGLAEKVRQGAALEVEERRVVSGQQPGEGNAIRFILFGYTGRHDFLWETECEAI